MHKNSIFIDRETVLNPQENTDSRSKDISLLVFKKLHSSEALFVTVWPFLFHFQFLKCIILVPCLQPFTITIAALFLIQEISVAGFFA